MAEKGKKPNIAPRASHRDPWRRALSYSRARMNLDEFQSALALLREQLLGPGGNQASLQCSDCENCVRCMFCAACDDCYHCTHCTQCRGCTECSHSERSSGCHGCSHITDCESCHGSAYLVSCANCSDCTYCFGCVGLQGKEFHILNQPYARKDYFAALKALQSK